MSTSAVRLPLSSAKKWAEHIVKVLAAACDRVEVAGSVRRSKRDVGDLEIVCIPKMRTDLLGQPVESELDDLLATKVQEGKIRFEKNGPRYKQLVMQCPGYEADGLKIDLFCTTPDRWGVIFAIRTGPGEFSQRLVTERCRGGRLPDGHCQRDGYIWKGRVEDEDGKVLKEGEKLEFADEREYLEFAGGWVDPHRRDKPPAPTTPGKRTKAAHNGTSTSIAGAIRFEKDLPKVDAKTLEIVRAAGVEGVTREQITDRSADFGRFMPIQTVCGAVKRLLEEGRIVETTETRTQRSGYPGKILKAGDS